MVAMAVVVFVPFSIQLRAHSGCFHGEEEQSPWGLGRSGSSWCCVLWLFVVVLFFAFLSS